MEDKSAISEIKKYYNSNTPNFLRSRKKKKAGAIHRKLYREKKFSIHDAEMYSNELLLEIIKSKGKKKILDLGCGVGGSIRYLINYHEADYTGITLSRVQTEISESLGTSIETADFLDTEWYSNQDNFDFIYAVESLQHNPDHEKLCSNLKLISNHETEIAVIDDFLTDGAINNRASIKYKKLFIKHWHAYGFTEVNKFIRIFEKNNFRLVEKQDLSCYMKKNKFLDILSGAIALAANIIPYKNPYIDNIIGGQSLKKLQGKHYSGYYKLVFKYEE